MCFITNYICIFLENCYLKDEKQMSRISTTVFSLLYSIFLNFTLLFFTVLYIQIFKYYLGVCLMHSRCLLGVYFVYARYLCLRACCRWVLTVCLLAVWLMRACCLLVLCLLHACYVLAVFLMCAWCMLDECLMHAWCLLETCLMCAWYVLDVCLVCTCFCLIFAWSA